MELYENTEMLHPMLNFSNAEMAQEINNDSYSVECVHAINEVASYLLHVGNVYLSMAYSFNDDSGMPSFALFFEAQADEKKKKVREILMYLRDHQDKISISDYKMPDMNELTTPVKALETALELEKKITELLLKLKSAATNDWEMDILKFLAQYINKHKRNEDYLECQLSYQKILVEWEQKQAQTESPSTSSGAKI